MIILIGASFIDRKDVGYLEIDHYRNKIIVLGWTSSENGKYHVDYLIEVKGDFTIKKNDSGGYDIKFDQLAYIIHCNTYRYTKYE